MIKVKMEAEFTDEQFKQFEKFLKKIDDDGKNCSCDNPSSRTKVSENGIYVYCQRCSKEI